MQFFLLLSTLPGCESSTHRSLRSKCLAATGSVLLLLAASVVAAHESSYPISADFVQVQASGGPSTSVFEFRVQNEEGLVLAHDPAAEGFSLLVRGSESSERTDLIWLDPARWSGSGGAAGYTYSDPTGTEGGITHVSLIAGSIEILGGGANWSWIPSGPQDSLRVEFWIDEEKFCAEFSSQTNSVIASNTAGQFTASQASSPTVCQEPVCGNGVTELGESCDDGNFDEVDGCTSLCEIGPCGTAEFDSTWEGIDNKILESCRFCHGDIPLSNSLSLSSGVAYENIVGVPSINLTNEQLYVLPGQPTESFLYRKLEAATNGTSLNQNEGQPMPSAGLPALSSDHLEAVRLWIRAGAPETGVVEGTANLMATCLPDPTPVKIVRPDPPPLGEGVQIEQTPWSLPAQDEDEICMATYFDFTQTDLIPADAQVDCPGVFGVNNPSDKCFYYNRTTLVQDVSSHHSIIHIYQGNYDVSYSGSGARQFGPFTYKRGAQVGQSCDPKDVDPFLGVNPDCSGSVVSTIACLSAPGLGTEFGPPDYSNSLSAPTFSGSQEPYYDFEFFAGVYALLPMRGTVIWNSHAFNLTDHPMTMDQYLNIWIADPSDRRFPVQNIFDTGSIFAEDVPAYGTQEVCRTYTIEQGAWLFSLNSHTHRFGVKFRIWAPPNTPCYPDANGNGCQPGDISQLMYLSTDYADPLQLAIDPPILYDSSNVADRTFLYCSEYDNGSTPESPSIKRQSTSPQAPANFGPFVSGGPCPNSTVTCLGGADAGELCSGNDNACDSGECDACPVRGGVTTEDEMFILIGTYYVPEPTQSMLLLAGLGGLLGVWYQRKRKVS